MGASLVSGIPKRLALHTLESWKAYYPVGLCHKDYTPFSRYSLGETPDSRLKYLPKKVCEGKFNSWLICWMVRFVDFNIILASSNTKLSIQSEAVLPLTFRTRVKR